MNQKNHGVPDDHQGRLDLVPANDTGLAVPVVTVRDGALWANSRDVATYFGRQHFHVLRDIDSIIGGHPILDGQQFQLVSAFDERANRTIRSFDMTKDGFTLLVMGFIGRDAMQFKLAYIERFNAMESKLRSRQTMDMRDPLQLAEMALQLTHMVQEEREKRVAAENQIAADKPKTAFYDEYVNADGLYTLQNAGRVLRQRPNLFIKRLRQLRYLFDQDGALVPYAAHVRVGRFEVKAETHNGRDRSQTFVTPKGIQHLAKRIQKAHEMGLTTMSDIAA